MSELRDRDMVIPGQLLGENVRCEGLCISCVREDNKTFSLVKGLARVENKDVMIIPSEGVYLPKPGDVVIGVVTDDLGGVYVVDIKAPYSCILKPRRSQGGRGGSRGGGRGGGRDRRGGGFEEEGEENFEVGDVISAKVASVDEVKEAQLMGAWKLGPGYVMQVKAKRVPRIIGKKKSMIDMIRNYTKSRITVGQNGLIWIKDGNQELAVEAILKVEREAQSSGLTDRITELLRSKSKN